MRRHAAQDEGKRRGNECADGEPAHDLKGDHPIVVPGERQQQRRKGEDRARPQQETSGTEDGAQPRCSRGDDHLGRGKDGGQPGAFIEAEAQAAPDIGEAECRDPRVERGDEGADQHRGHADQRTLATRCQGRGQDAAPACRLCHDRTDRRSGCGRAIRAWPAPCSSQSSRSPTCRDAAWRRAGRLGRARS
jgi:hypothetical protein